MKCQGFMGRLFGHKFQPRYDMGASALELGNIKTSAHAVLKLAERYRPYTYRGEVCARCGTFIDRRNQP